MAINKVIYGTDTLVDLTEDTVTAEDVLNSKSFHTPDGVQRTGTASYPVTDVQVNGTSVMDGTVAKVEQPTADKKTATSEFNTADGGLLSKCQINLVPVQSGSGDPSPDNVRPISGHTEVGLANVGRNKLPHPTNGTYGNVVVTTNNDGSVSFVGNCNSNASVDFYRDPARLPDLIEQLKTYTVSLTNAINEFDIFYSTDGSTYDGTPLVKLTTTTTATFTVPSNATGLLIRALVKSDSNYNVTIYPQIEEGSAVTSYEPYLGHLYQVQIGSTVYGGYVDLVSGVMVATHGFITLNGTENITKSATTSRDIYIYTITPANFSQPFITSAFKYSSTAISAVGYAWRGTSDTQIRIGYAEYGTTTVNDFKTWLSNNPLQICYELATPTTIQLTPQQIETLAGQNNLSTPLDGQSIETNGVEYKELFTFADVKEYVKPLIPYSNAGSHNAIYRGKYLGDHVTPEQWASIVAGTFDDLFIGDYWTINSVNWRIAHFDYWLGTGDTECTDHHVVIVPDTSLYSAKMNTSATTAGGYYNSEMHGGDNYLVSGSSGLYDAKVAIDNAFGSEHILSHREVLTNAISSDNASGWAWCNSSVDLMSEVMVYGTLAWSIGGKGFEVGDGMGQLALFRHDISKVTNRSTWWLRNVTSSSFFAHVLNYGRANSYTASSSYGVRPCFAIK